MGLFDRLRKGSRGAGGATEAPGASVVRYSGMRVEALTGEGELLFMAKLAISASGAVELQLLPGYTGPTGDEAGHVLIRGFDEETKQAVHMEGDLRRVAASIWRVTGLKIVSRDNDRAYYRQDVGNAGDVMLVGQMGMPKLKSCIVENISAGGVCIQADEKYQIGNRLMLRSQLLPSSEMALLCTVCRISEPRPGIFEYGCKFENLDAAAKDQISKAIMQLQMRKARR